MLDGDTMRFQRRVLWAVHGTAAVLAVAWWVLITISVGWGALPPESIVDVLAFAALEALVFAAVTFAIVEPRPRGNFAVLPLCLVALELMGTSRCRSS